MRPTLQQRFEAKVSREPTSGCWLWLGQRAPNRYGVFSIGSRSMTAHRVAWQLYRGEIPAGKLVCHHCDVPECVNPDHLFLGTPKENSADMKSKGRSSRGERHYRARLTWNQVREIRKLLAEGNLWQREIAAIYGVSQRTISAIKTGKRWPEKPSPDPTTTSAAETQTPVADESGFDGSERI